MKITESNLTRAVLGGPRQVQSGGQQKRAASNPPDSVIISSVGRELSERDPASKEGDSIEKIMSGKSLRNIGYSELVSLAGKLRDAGHLAEKDCLDFIGPSPEFAMLDGSRNSTGGAPMDFVGRHEMNIAFMAATGSEQRFIDFEKHLLSLFKSFEQ